MEESTVIGLLNKHQLVDKTDSLYKSPKGSVNLWTETEKALEKYDSPQAKALLKRLRSRK